MFFHLWGRYGIMSTDIIHAPVRRPTKGRTSSLANRVHAPQGNMSGGHGIISSDIIPALICVRPEGGQFLWQIMRMPRRETWTKDMV